MTKTLPAIGVAATVLTGVVMAAVTAPGFLPASGAQDHPQIERFLNGPTAMDRFRQQLGDKMRNDQDATPLLVEQVRLFAKTINPPRPRRQEPGDDTYIRIVVPPEPRFSLQDGLQPMLPGSAFGQPHMPLSARRRNLRPGASCDGIGGASPTLRIFRFAVAGAMYTSWPVVATLVLARAVMKSVGQAPPCES